MATKTIDSPLKEKTFKFAVRIISLNRYLISKKCESVIVNQVLRSGTNPGAMVRESAYAESSADFIHKLGVARKEINESIYWLELLHTTDLLSDQEFLSIRQDAEEILKILTSSILTKRKKQVLKGVFFSLVMLLSTALALTTN